MKLKELRALRLIDLGSDGYVLSPKGLEVADLLIKLESTVLGGPPEFTNVERIPHEVYRGLIRKYCEILHELYGSDLRSIVLMGSVARGDWDEDSDIDLLIVVDSWDQKPLWNRLRELRACVRKLRATSEFERALNQDLAATIQHYPMSRSEASEFHRIYIDACIDSLILFDMDEFIYQSLARMRQKLVEHGARRIQLPEGRYYWILKDIKAGEIFTL